jgi:hypothetical protein
MPTGMSRSPRWSRLSRSSRWLAKVACAPALLVALSCTGEAVSPGETHGSGSENSAEDDVKVDTRGRLAREQYDANVRFALDYQPRCVSTGAPKRVLLTGFGRFLDISDNATGRILAQLVPNAPYPETTQPAPGEIDPPGPQLSVGATRLSLPGVGEVDVCAMIVPVYWDLASLLIAKEVAAFAPDLVVMNGVYPGASWLTLELGSINRAVAAPDGSGILTPSGGDGSLGLWGRAPLLEDVPAEDDARGLLLSYDAVREAAETKITALAERDDGTGVRFADRLSGVKLGGFPRDNTYLCNNTAYVVSWLLDHPATPVDLLRADPPLDGAINAVSAQIEPDFSAIPRVFVHWPDSLVADHVAASAELLTALVAAQLTATSPPVRGNNAWADPDLAGEPRPASAR